MGTVEPIVASMRTDIGRIHDHNEDYISCREPTTSDEEKQSGWLYVVADGVGGAEAGEIASEFATDRVISHFLASDGESDWGERLRHAMLKANTELRQMVATEHESRRMATTMVTAVIHDGRAHIANVGDSRAYHWRTGEIRQVTRDQSLVAKLVEEGAISAAEAENHPYQNVILYSIGSDKNPKIDVFELGLDAGDILVLCSDGLTKHVSDAEIADFIARQEPALATQSLIQLANERGGKDNISVAVLQYGQQSGRRQPALAPAGVAAPARPPGPTVADAGVAAASSSRLALWLLTVFLALLQSILIILAWIMIRV